MITIGENGLADLNLRRAMARHVKFVLDYCKREDGTTDYAWAASELGIDMSTLNRWRKSGALGLGLRLTVRPWARRA